MPKHQIVCPHCESLNFRSGAKLAHEPGRCGLCGRALFDGKPLALGSAAFKSHLKENSIPFLVDFSANWCGPCKTMAPVFEMAARELEPCFRLAKVDTDKEPRLAGGQNVRGLPTLVIYHHGHEVARRAGAMPLGDLLTWAKTHVHAKA